MPQLSAGGGLRNEGTPPAGLSGVTPPKLETYGGKDEEEDSWVLLEEASRAAAA